jgi:hypothetical protein
MRLFCVDNNNFVGVRDLVCRIDSLHKLSPPFVSSFTLCIFYHDILLRIFLLYLRFRVV